MMATTIGTKRVLGFTKDQCAELGALGVTAPQLAKLAPRLSTIRQYILGDPPQKDVLEPLSQLHLHLAKAEKIVQKLIAPKRSAAQQEARSYLAAGAHAFDARDACKDLELATEGTVPDWVDVPTLLRILVNASKSAITQVPRQARRPTAPWRAVNQIVIALRRPLDADSRSSAKRLKVTRAAGSDFVMLCSIVFDAAAGIKPRAARTASVGEPRGDVERAIRRFLEEQDAGNRKI